MLLRQNDLTLSRLKMYNLLWAKPLQAKLII